MGLLTQLQTLCFSRKLYRYAKGSLSEGAGTAQAVTEGVFITGLSPMPLFKQLCGLQAAGRALPAAGGRHGVVSPPAQRIAPGNAPCAQQNAFYTAVGQNGLCLLYTSDAADE